MRTAVAALAVAMAVAVAGTAQADYPDRPITVVVPFGAGGGTDTVARVIADPMGEKLGQRVIIENRGGANGALGASAVARAEADGYTLLMTTSTTHAANPSLMRQLTYDPVADFAPIARIGYFPFILAVGKDVPAQTVQELVDYAKAHPGELTYAHWQATTIVAGNSFNHTAGVDTLGVAYKGTTPAVTDVLGGRVSMIFIDIPSGKAHIEAGSLRPLAVTTAERSSIMPDLVSLNEAGLKGYDISSWMGFYAPAGTPEPIVEKLNAAVTEVLAMPAVKARLAQLGFDVSPTSAAELADYTRTEIDRWRGLITAAGIEPQ